MQDKREGGKEKNNACRQVVVLSLPNVHLADWFLLAERGNISLFSPLSLLSNALYGRLKTRLSTLIAPVEQPKNKELCLGNYHFIV